MCCERFNLRGEHVVREIHLKGGQVVRQIQFKGWTDGKRDLIQKVHRQLGSIQEVYRL